MTLSPVVNSLNATLYGQSIANLDTFTLSVTLYVHSQLVVTLGAEYLQDYPAFFYNRLSSDYYVYSGYSCRPTDV